MYPTIPPKSDQELRFLLEEKRQQFQELIGQPLRDELLLEFLEEQLKDKIFGRLSGLLGHLDARNTALLIRTITDGRGSEGQPAAISAGEVTNTSRKGASGRPRAGASTEMANGRGVAKP